MTRQERGTAICIIRMEPQADGMLISVRVNPDIQEISGERRYHFADVEQAVCAVRDFLEGYRDDLQPFEE
ncbi:hypothetical protein [Actinopolymorpha pittospori]